MTPTDIEIINYEQMHQLVESIFDVFDILNSMEKTAHWFTIKNPHLGNMRPIDMFLIGRGHKVLSFIRNAKEGNLP